MSEAGNRWRRLAHQRAGLVAVVAMGVVIAGAAVTLMVSRADTPGPDSGSERRERVEGFGEIAFRVGGPDARPRCALLAETEEQRQRGLMGRMTLGGYDAMLFVFPTDTTTSFYMKDTRLPLSIAWFDAAGRFVSSTEMEPCLDGMECPLYSADEPYRYALEVPRGGLARLGLGAGSTITVGGACT